MIFAFFGFLQELLQFAWRTFFWYTRGIYSSDFLSVASPILIFLLVAWRVFGPAEQGGGIAHSKTRAGEIDKMPLVNDMTYGGGPTTAAASNVGPLVSPKNAERKKKD